jgi:hypothetical protein
MNKLFTQTSNVLRDNWISELQKNNNFLKNKLHNINLNPFFGYKIRISPHLNGMTQENILETNGVIYSLRNGNVWAIIKNENNEISMRRFHITNIEFTDVRFHKLFE